MSNYFDHLLYLNADLIHNGSVCRLKIRYTDNGLYTGQSNLLSRMPSFQSFLYTIWNSLPEIATYIDSVELSIRSNVTSPVQQNHP